MDEDQIEIRLSEDGDVAIDSAIAHKNTFEALLHFDITMHKQADRFLRELQAVASGELRGFTWTGNMHVVEIGPDVCRFSYAGDRGTHGWEIETALVATVVRRFRTLTAERDWFSYD